MTWLYWGTGVLFIAASFFQSNEIGQATGVLCGVITLCTAGIIQAIRPT